jgi:plasmid stability protein
MFSKIAIRNIPSQIFRALETLADLHDRSTEAEARQALRAWVEPLLVLQHASLAGDGLALPHCCYF